MTLLQQLEKSVCPPLDSALLHAIACDYNLDNAGSAAEFEQVVQALKEQALFEETCPSPRPRSWQGMEMDSLSINPSSGDREAMMHDFCAMFPRMREHDIAHVISKTKADYNRALEELLNINLLEDEAAETGHPIILRGVDGLGEQQKKTKKRPVRRRSSSNPEPLTPKSINVSRWDRAKEEVDFVASRTYISTKVLTSLYNKHNASLAQTIEAVGRLDDLNNPYAVAASSKARQDATSTLSSQLPELSAAQCKALVAATYPSTSSARELGLVLLRGTKKVENLVPQYKPSVRDEPKWVIRPRGSVHGSSAELSQMRSEAFSKASESYRRSRSKPLMGGAAAYYSAIGREAHVALREAQSAEAWDLVQSQSQPGELDLHGVSVRDAISIAPQAVEDWWERERHGEWARKVPGQSLRIVVGRGQHSEKGRARIGPAVATMLLREGWRAEVGSGVIDVVGRAITK